MFLIDASLQYNYYKACHVWKSVSAGDGKKDKKDGDALVKMETDKK